MNPPAATRAWNASVVVNTYASSGSPARWDRVVQDRLSQSRGSRSRRAWTIVPFPTPPGPEMTTIRTSAQLVEQGLTLLGPEAPDPAALRDPDVVHDPPRLHLADTGEGLEQRHHLELADDVVAVSLAEGLRQGHRPHLELFLQLGAGGPGLGSLLERRRPLFRGESGRVGHGRDPSAGCFRPRGMGPGQTLSTRAAAAAAGSSAAVTARPM